MEEIDSKEVSDALHMLLHCSLKDKEFETQKEQFEIVSAYIKKLEEENKEINDTCKKLRSFQYDYGYMIESVFLMDTRLLTKIQKNKYFIEIDTNNFVDVKELYEKCEKYKNSIPKSVIEEKIEELEEKNKESKTNIYGYGIHFLQELLEKGE